MKRILIIALASAIAAVAWAQPKIAVLDATIPKNMDPSVIIPVTDKITESFVGSGRYTVLDRDNVDSILKEREFQLSDMVSDQDAATAGKYLGADFVVVIKVQKLGDTYYVSGKTITVKSGVIAKQGSAQGEGKIAALIDLAQEVGEKLSGNDELGTAAPKKAKAAAQAENSTKNAGEKPLQVAGGSRKSAGLPVLLNIIPGLGVGSFVEGDTLGGLLILGGGALAWTLVIGGAIASTDAVALNPNATTGYGEIWAGLLTGAGIGIFGIVRPITFANKWNDEHGFASLDVLPTLTPTSSSGAAAVAPGAVLKLSF